MKLQHPFTGGLILGMAAGVGLMLLLLGHR